MAKAKTTKQQHHTAANLGFEAKLWAAADAQEEARGRCLRRWAE